MNCLFLVCNLLALMLTRSLLFYSAVVEVVAPVKIGSEITMRLMMREKGSVWPRPVSQWEDRGGLFYNIKGKIILALIMSLYVIVIYS